MDLIGELLQRRLLTEIGEGEERLTMVRESAVALSKRFKGDLRSLVPHAVVAAVDENCGAEVEPLRHAYDELAAQWETVRNAFDGPPLSLLRAITLEAVANAATDDSKVLAAGWYSLRTALEELPTGSWAEALSDLAKVWDDAVWESVEASWSPVSVSSKVTMPSVPKFDGDRISAPTSATAREEAASYVASANWQTFSQLMMSGYPAHVEALVGASEVAAADALRKSNEELRTFAGELGKKLRDILSAQENAIESTRLRGELLWWQRTAFSPTRRVGYSDLEPSEVPVVAAYDLHLLMPAVAPLAAEHLLAGVVAKASGNAKVSIDDLSAAADLPSGSGHTPTLILGAAQSDANTGLLARSARVKAGRAAVLLFRDLQARRLSGTGSDES